MMITNKRQLSNTRERRLALEALETALKAVSPRNLVEKSVHVRGGKLEIQGRTFALNYYDRVYVVGAGKACARMAEAIEALLPVTEGRVNVVTTCDTRKIVPTKCTHPFASQANVDATEKIMELAEKTTEKDLVACLISGGGSSLLCAPKGVTLEEKQATTKKLMLEGATISELNCVRKHLSSVKGGNLAKALYPATVISLIISDVVGDDLGVIASGPTVSDETTKQDALRILEKYGLKNSRAYEAAKANGETPREKKFFEKVHNFVIGSNDVALEAAKKYLAGKGVNARKISGVTGEARLIGTRLARMNEDFVAGGETTVTVKGNGKGGRNQELALSFALNNWNGLTFVSVGSDGIDGNSPAAGAIVDAETKTEKAKKFLDDNDSYSFFEANGGAIFSGPTGTNVNDIMIGLKRFTR